MGLLNNGLQQLQPTQTKNLYQGNYLDFTNANFSQWTQQFLPDVYDQEINIYGNRTISGFLKMVSAEMPTTSDQIIWTEQGRLHARYTGGFIATSSTAAASGAITGSTSSTANDSFFKISIPAAQDGGTIADVAYRVGQTIMIQKQAASSLQGASAAVLFKGIITHVDDLTIRGSFYNADQVTAGSGNGGFASGDVVTTLVYGSEYSKGTSGMEGTIHPQYKTYSNAPIIMKDHFAINGSDTSQIGWIEIDSENGASGYLWYMKSEHENRLRWEDYMEMSMIESIKADAEADGSAAGTQGTSVSGSQGLRGTEGFFQALDTRANVWEGLSNDLSASSATLGNTFDEILKVMDKNAAVEENMLYVNRNIGSWI